MSYEYRVTLTDEAGDLVEKLVQIGIYGRNGSDVMRRIVDAKLVEIFIAVPKAQLKKGQPL